METKNKKIIDNRYIVEKKIGIGGFAIVYKAWAKNLEKFVALKKIHEFYVDDRKSLDMFKDEAVNTAKLEHENIVRVIDFIKTGSSDYWIVMDYIRGRDLEYIIKKARELGIKIPPEVSVHVLAEVLKALDYAHSKKDEITNKPLSIVHRDVSPGNIMICFNGKVKLADFGIARVESRRAGLTRAGVLKGKVSYMSPEQAEGKRNIDKRTDIYSLGIVMWELLTGRKLYEGDTDLEVLHKVRRIEISYKNIPEELRSILSKAMHKDAGKRYQDAKEMSADLQKYLAGRKFSGRQEKLKEFMKQFPEEEEEETSFRDRGRTILKPAFSFGKALKAPGSAVKRKKGLLLRVLLVLLLGGCVFEVYDVLNQKTWLGRRINSIIFPRGFIINSVPGGAEVSLSNNDREVFNSGENKTPLLVEKVLPGEYVLTLKKQGFESTSKGLVIGDGNRMKIEGGSSSISGGRRNFTIPLGMNMFLDSIPGGAAVSINGEVKGITPLTCSVPAGELDVSMTIKGLGSIGAKGTGRCRVNTLKKPDEQKGIDNRFWDFMLDNSGKILKASLTGTFFRKISIDSIPGDASVYIDDKKESAGVTPIKELFIKPGRHKLRIEKYRYDSWEKVIDVNVKDDVNICPELKKKIRVYSYMKDGPGKDINARVAIEGTGVKSRKTPFSYSLIPGVYVMKFTREGYAPLTKKVKVRDVYRIEAELVPEAEKKPVYDGTLIVDTSPDYTGSKIFVDGKAEGDTVRKIKGLERSSHTVVIKHPDLPKPAEKTVVFSNPDQVIVLKLDSNGGIYIENTLP